MNNCTVTKTEVVMDYTGTQKVMEEIKENILKFYDIYGKECEECYNVAMGTNGIYHKIKNRHIFNEYLLKSQVAILTANMFEKNILHMRSDSKKIYHYQIDCFDNILSPVNINIYFFKINGFNIVHLEAAQTGSYTIGGSADLVRYIIGNPYIHPSCVISFGVCFGNDYKKLSLGDTIIAKKIYPYFISAKVSELELTVTDNNVFKIKNEIETKLKHLFERNYFEGIKVHFGNLITGEAVINNALIKEIFIKASTNQPVLGGEMEGYGLFKECQIVQNSIPCLIIKSICDWGIAKNIDDMNTDVTIYNIKDKLQAYASNSAYNVLEKLLNDKIAVFIPTIYDSIKDKIKKLKQEGNHALTLDMVDKMLNEIELSTGRIVNTEYKELLLEILSNESVIKKNSSVYKII